ncbi:CLUMA_CG002686, isoform A [Clunio marinus]|uniref:CLUMA_CG002686, isoform A n=1 Tax=Clunio marinus TaxID=568069 RepID=A0A1J1HM10_9DIPT|nr:CLUMA_CG002686, isoform A [Clunio marinus]
MIVRCIGFSTTAYIFLQSDRIVGKS